MNYSLSVLHCPTINSLKFTVDNFVSFEKILDLTNRESFSLTNNFGIVVVFIAARNVVLILLHLGNYEWEFVEKI